MKRVALLSVLLAGCLAVAASAETYRVGPDRPIKSLAQIAPKLQPGDVVLVDPGVYRELVKLTASGTADRPIVIRGTGERRPIFDAAGLAVTGKGPVPRAILQIEGAYYVIENLELRNARNGHTAAGVRLNGSTNATIRNCYIHHNDLGVFGDDTQTATIEGCEVAYNSTEKWRGYAHNFYMHGNRVVVRNCYIHNSPFGQNFKSRAHYNELWYNWIADSDEGEVGPVEERPGKAHGTELANSNTLLVGNVIVSGQRGGNPGKFILFGSEMKFGGAHNGTLYLFNNTLVAGSEKIIFIQLADKQARLVAHNNVFYGSDKILATPKPAVSVTGSHNWLADSASAPAGFAGNIRSAAPGFLDAAGRDFRLKPDSPCVNRGAGELSYVDGDGATHPLRVTRSPWPMMRAQPREITGPIDLGAYEQGATRPAGVNLAPLPTTQKDWPLAK